MSTTPLDMHLRSAASISPRRTPPHRCTMHLDANTTTTTTMTMESIGSTHLLLTPTALWAAVCVWSCLEVAFYFLLTRVIHPRLEPPRDAPQGPLAPRECLARLVDTLERLKGVSLSSSRHWLGGVGGLLAWPGLVLV